MEVDSGAKLFSGGKPMNELERSLRRIVNPLSTGLTRARCHSPLHRWALRREVGILTEMPKSRRRSDWLEMIARPAKWVRC